ncbi:MAG: hypothetical protein ACR2MA_12695 [Egibacteraceae bacterium]
MIERVRGVVRAGHGVASGRGGDPRYPDGTIALQLPVFARLGVVVPGRDLSAVHPGTVNVDLAPAVVEWVAAPVTVRKVEWSAHAPPEDFSFAPCRVGPAGEPLVDAICYRPHPETKPEHEQPPGVLEVLAPWIEGLVAGEPVDMELDPTQIIVRPDGP